MKILKFLQLALLTVFVFASCDSNKGKVEELTKQFATAVKSNDAATIYDMYPEAKLAECMKLPSKIDLAEITVEKDDSTGNYIATINNPREQKLVFTPAGEDKFKITDSYGLFELNKEYTDLAIKTGIPMKQLSDRTLSSLFKDGSKFMEMITEEYGAVNDLNLSDFDGVYNYFSYGMVQVNQNIRNDGDFPVKGKDYDIILHFDDRSGYSVASTKTMEGVDLEPGETFTYTFELNGYARAAYYKTLHWTVSFNKKGGDSLKEILKKAKFTGSEYAEYEKENKTTNNKKQKGGKK